MEWGRLGDVSGNWVGWVWGGWEELWSDLFTSKQISPLTRANHLAWGNQSVWQVPGQTSCHRGGRGLSKPACLPLHIHHAACLASIYWWRVRRSLGWLWDQEVSQVRYPVAAYLGADRVCWYDSYIPWYIHFNCLLNSWELFRFPSWEGKRQCVWHGLQGEVPYTLPGDLTHTLPGDSPSLQLCAFTKWRETILKQNQVERAPQFLLRGLSSSSSFDYLYSLNEDLHNGRRQFVGPSGWMIRWDGARWVLECQR